MAYIENVEYQIKRTCVGCEHNAGFMAGPLAKAPQSKDYMYCKKNKGYIHKDEVASYGCEFGRNTIHDSWIDEACEWLENNSVDYVIEGARFGLKIEEMVKDFKEDMIKYEQNMYKHRTE
jgi:hypothetical protein